jgi:S-adenosylmethionine hydrolase
MARRARPIITLLTDFGTADPYVAAMKGTILDVCPVAEIVDISHEIPPHDILSAAFVLANAAPAFPEGTAHVVVVDPGVGTGRDILVGQYGGQHYIFPDNGVITFIKEVLPLEGLVAVRNLRSLGFDQISHTFHGRDIMAPLAASLAMGMEPGELGPTPARYKLLDLPLPESDETGMAGRILYVDHFGNLISNIQDADIRSRFKDRSSVRVECNGQTIGGIHETYGQASLGQSLALINSMGLLEVAVCQGRAADALGAGVGAEITIRQQQYLEG